MSWSTRWWRRTPSRPTSGRAPAAAVAVAMLCAQAALAALPSADGGPAPDAARGDAQARATEGGPVSEYLLVHGVALEASVLAARRMSTPFWTLYDRLVESEFVELSPHLFRYEPESTPAQVWLALGRGRALAMRLASRAPPEQLVRHLQTYLLADAPGGEDGKKQIYLLFFDPRVMHTLLRTLHAEQRRAFFGPVERWIVESDDEPSADVVYSLDARGELVVRTEPAPTSRLSREDAERELQRFAQAEDEAAVRKHLAQFGQLQAFSSAHGSATPFSSVCPCNAFTLSRPSGVAFDRAQHAQFSAHAVRWYKRRTMAWLARHDAKDMEPEALKRLVDEGYLQADGYDISTERAVADYLALCARHGLAFHKKPWAQAILKSKGLDGAEKVKRLQAKLE